MRCSGSQPLRPALRGRPPDDGRVSRGQMVGISLRGGQEQQCTTTKSLTNAETLCSIATLYSPRQSNSRSTPLAFRPGLQCKSTASPLRLASPTYS